MEWDYADWNQRVETFVKTVKSVLFEEVPATGYRLVLTGIASPKLKDELVAQTIALTEKALPGPLR